MSKTVCEQSLSERIKVCPNCKHFLFKDDTVDFCVSCFNPIETDLDVVIVEKSEEGKPQGWVDKVLSLILYINRL
jgi:predicted amidophosphoribosyltransferase